MSRLWKLGVSAGEEVQKNREGGGMHSDKMQLLPLGEGGRPPRRCIEKGLKERKNAGWGLEAGRVKAPIVSCRKGGSKASEHFYPSFLVPKI